jgi:hypothetical protein
LFGAGRQRSDPPRTVRADGVPFGRPWRTASPDVVARVNRLRNERRQPRWPRALGVGLMAVALFAAWRSIDSAVSHVQAVASADPHAGQVELRAGFPAHEVKGTPSRFEWQASADAVVVVLCDASYREILRIEARGGSLLSEGALARELTAGGTFHWFVECAQGGRLSRSPFQTFQIR